MPDVNGNYRILSLDGGGSWVLLEMMALSQIYGANARGLDILSRFDLVTANSGGSIVLALLASNRTVQQMIGLIGDQSVRSDIFQEIPLFQRLWGSFGFGPKYFTAPKLAALTQAIDNGPGQDASTLKPASVPLANLSATLGIATEFIIPSFNFDTRRARYFRSNPASPAAGFSPPDTTTLLVEAVHTTSTPPVLYFDKPAEIPAGRFWDGGVSGLNNPVEVGAMELIAKGIDPARILALSLGSGSVSLPAVDPATANDPSLVLTPGGTGFVDTLKELAGSIVDDPPDAASFHAHVALRGRMPTDSQIPVADGPVTRLNPLVRPILSGGTWSAPVLNSPANAAQDLTDFQTLANLGLDAVAQSDVDAITKLGNAWIQGTVRNQPIRWRPAEDVGCEIGTADFASGLVLAKARFQ